MCSACAVVHVQSAMVEVYSQHLPCLRAGHDRGGAVCGAGQQAAAVGLGAARKWDLARRLLSAERAYGPSATDTEIQI